MSDRREPWEAREFPHEVQIHTPDPNDIQSTYDVIEWLESRSLRVDRDWIIDMHGGQLSYTSFYLRDTGQALLTKLTWGGR